MDAPLSSPRKALLAGATGLVGSALLPMLCDSPRYQEVHVLVRRSGLTAPAKARLHQIDFASLSQVPAVDDVFIALGTTIKVAGSQAAFRQVDFDFSGTLEEVLEPELPRPAAQGPGRPKLGVVSREVSLLPQHWAWLEEQPNGISAALRRLVDEASKRDPDKQRARKARDATGRFMTALAGDRPNFEEAMRALYAGDRETLTELTKRWPKDIRAQLARMLG